jgi:signal transduction histidine kinase
VQQNPQLANYVEAVNDSGRNLLEIINAILDMARLESSNRSLQESLFPVADVIAEVEQAVGAQAADKGVNLHFPRSGAVMANFAGLSGDPGTIDPALKMRGELRAFRQALMNILGNAIKFTARGGAVTLAPSIRHNGDLALTVIDTGIGIDANLIPFLTLPFTQAGSAWTRRKGGIGLGLAITKKLLDLHQGTIEVASRYGEGTRITLIFPATRLAWKGAAPVNELDSTVNIDPITAQSRERSGGTA